jgi:type IV secretion system protein VirB3
MSARNSGLVAEPLFVGATRPPMRWGVTYTALLCNLVFTMEAFLVTRNLLTLLVCIPIHAACALMCTRDARFFDLLALCLRLRLPALFANRRHWRANAYSPLILPGRRGAMPRHCSPEPRQ